MYLHVSLNDDTQPLYSYIAESPFTARPRLRMLLINYIMDWHWNFTVNCNICHYLFNLLKFLRIFLLINMYLGTLWTYNIISTLIFTFYSTVIISYFNAGIWTCGMGGMCVLCYFHGWLFWLEGGASIGVLVL